MLSSPIPISFSTPFSSPPFPGFRPPLTCGLPGQARNYRARIVAEGWRHYRFLAPPRTPCEQQRKDHGQMLLVLVDSCTPPLLDPCSPSSPSSFLPPSLPFFLLALFSRADPPAGRRHSHLCGQSSDPGRSQPDHRDAAGRRMTRGRSS